MSAQAVSENSNGEAAPPRADAAFGSFAELMALSPTMPDPGLATPVLAQAWTDAVLLYWQHGIACGAIDPTRPLYLAGLAPAQGLLAWRMLQALREGLRRRQLDASICLIACCRTQDEADALLGHPCLNEFVRQGWLDAALFDGGNGSALTLQHQNLSVLAAANPLVILALGHFATLPSELMAAHYGQLLQSAVAVHEVEGSEHLELSYDWQPAPESATTPLPDYYRQHFHSAALLLPDAATQTLQRLERIAGGRYLLLGADPGVCDEQAIRLGGMMPPEQWHAGRMQLPVNYHALSFVQSQAGASVWNRQMEDGGIVLHAAWRGDGAAAGMPQITALLDAAHPDHGQALQRAIASQTDAAAVLALLRQSRYDPAMLMAAIDTLLNKPPQLTNCARREWHAALAAVWHNYLPGAHCGGLLASLARLAVLLGFPGLAKDCLRQSLHFFGDDTCELYLLAWCEAQTGDSVAALSRVSHALAFAPDFEAARSLHAELTDKLQRWQSLPFYRPKLAAEGALRIEPLGAEHAADLHFQFRDEQISVMTRLPMIGTVEQAQAWIAKETSDACRHLFAVVHEQHGFVGVVAVHCARQAGYFYFWTGSDHQGRGFGQGAARLLFAQLHAAGVTEIYTSVEQINRCSRHVLEKLGFVRLAVHPAPPDDTQDFYYLGEDKSQARMAAGLLELCSGIGSPLKVI
jgi:RimJ/RimL family protein N-acetyltransferase